MVDARDSKSRGFGRVGSSPTSGTRFIVLDACLIFYKIALYDSQKAIHDITIKASLKSIFRVVLSRATQGQQNL